MKSKFKYIFISVFFLLFLSPTKVFASSNEFNLLNNNVITIDGDFSDWEGLPYSYEYNWDNSSNCWYWGVWIGNTCYKTPEGTFDTNVRHKMQLYCDGTYVYLHIIYSRDYNSKANGNDFQFFINGEQTAFNVEFEDRSTLANQSREIGTYELYISHRNTALSYEKVKDSLGYLVVHNEDNINNELELKIPLEEMYNQNNNINLDTISTIEFFTNNLMYRRISAAGISTYPFILGIICFFIVIISIVFLKKKGKLSK